MAPLTSLHPNVDRRFHEWLERQERLKRDLKHEVRPTICISRRYGCEAYPLAELLKKDLEALTHENWTIFDKSLIEKVSKDQGLSKELLNDLDLYRTPTKVSDFLQFLFSNNWKPPYHRAYQLLTRYVVKIAREGNAIIVGRGASVVTQEQPACFHFRLDATLDWRIHSMARRLDINIEEAEVEVKVNQTAREKFLETYLNCDLSEIKFYHLMFNNEKVSIAMMAEMIIKVVRASGLLKADKKAPDAA